MTITNKEVRTRIACSSAAQTSFTIGFAFFDNSEIEVWVRDETGSTVTETQKTLTTHYTLTGSPATTVVFGTAPATGKTGDDIAKIIVVMRRVLPLEQTTDYAVGDAFPADSHETALDKLVALTQQIKEITDRAYILPHTYEKPPEVSLTAPEPENDGIIKWNSDATALVMDTDLATSAYKLKVSGNELTPNYLDDKLSGGTGLTKVTSDNPSGEETVTFNVDAAQTQITSVGALNTGTITSGFGAIDNGSSTITTTGTVSAGLIAGAAVKDEDNMASDSATHLASQQSIKAYVDAVTSSLDAQDLDVVAGGDSIDIDLSSEALTITGGTGATSSAAGTTVTIAVDAAQTQITSVGALDGGSITSGFGAINTGSSTITTSGAVTGGTLVGTVSTATQNSITTATGLTSTGALDAGSITSNFGTINTGSSGITTSGAVTGGTLAGTVSTATQNSITTATGLTSTGALDAGSITSNFGTINTGASNITTTGTVSAGLIAGAAVKDEDNMASDSATHLATQQSIKAYVDDNAGGGGAGSIDTLFTMQAKSADAAYTARGNGYVWSGTGSITNATLALETTALDLIQSEKVFAYDSGGSGVRNWWYHEQAIQTGYGGKNMILQLQYFTRNCADSNIFRFYARDAAKPVFTSDGSADAGTNQILGAVAWDASLSTSAPDDRKAAAVGDRIVIIDTSNNIHYRYITAVSPDDRDEPGALTITYSGADIAPANSTVMLIGVMTDELDYLPANNMAAAGNNEAKVYRKQMQFPEGCRLFQFGFHVESTDVDVELYYDDIALSANQFLQVSSQGQSEYYHANNSNFWDSSGSVTYRFNESFLNPGPGTPTLSNSKLISIIDGTNNSVNSSRIYAKQKIKLSMSFTDIVNDDTLYFFDSSDEILLGDRRNTSGRYGSIGIEIILEKDDYITCGSDNPYNRDGQMNIVATPLVNDVVLLNSQDEIFSDWVSYSPTIEGLNPASYAINWRRVGDSMEVSGYIKTGTISSSDEPRIFLPSGYSIRNNAGGDNKQIYGFYTRYAGANWVTGDAITGCVILDTASMTSVGLSSRTADQDVFLLENAASYFSNSDALSFNFTVPIAGWTASFNPVLSMPLVDFGTFENTYSAVISGTSVSTTSADFIDSISQGGTDSGQWTITYKTGFFSVAPAVQVTVDSTTSHGRIGQVVSHSSSNCVISSVNQSSGAQTANDVHNMMLTVVRQGSDYKPPPPQATAAVIKPAVAYIRHSKTGHGGDAVVSGTAWQKRVLNQINGESWFITAFDTSNSRFTLGAGMYDIECRALFYQTANTSIRLYNQTDSSYFGGDDDGSFPSYSHDTGSHANAICRWYGVVTITSAKACELHYRASYATSHGYGLGAEGVGLTNETFALVKVTKLK